MKEIICWTGFQKQFSFTMHSRNKFSLPFETQNTIPRQVTNFDVQVQKKTSKTKTYNWSYHKSIIIAARWHNLGLKECYSLTQFANCSRLQ